MGQLIPEPIFISAGIVFDDPDLCFLDPATGASLTLTVVPNVPPRRTGWPGRI
jgi:hypothetical protein